MRKIREVLRLKFDCCRLTKRQIAKSCAIARSTVAEYLRRFFASGLSWPPSPATDDDLQNYPLLALGANCRIAEHNVNENPDYDG